MKIVTKEDINNMPFGLIECGSCFEYRGQFFLKTAEPQISIRLDDGQTFTFKGSETVNRVKAQVVIGDAEG